MSARGRPVVGILLMLFSMSCIGVVDAFGKLMMERIPQVQLVGSYFAVIVVLAAAYGLGNGMKPRELFTTKAPHLQALRGLMLALSLSLLFYALKYLPLAEATVVSFTSPLWIVALSAPLLGEKVGWRRWAAVLVGLTGAAIVMRPGTDIFQWMALLPLIGAIFFALFQIVTRLLAGRDRFETTLCCSFAVGSVLVLTAAALTNWKTPDVQDLFAIAGLGGLGFIAHLTMVQSLNMADASLVAPFNYVRVIWAIGLGYLLFGAVPGFWTFVGGGIVIASGLYVLWRETRSQ